MSAAPRANAQHSSANRVSAGPASAGSLGGDGRGRLLLSGPGEAAENMAIDAALLAGAAGAVGPTLRFYWWREPTLSLGYFQRLDQRAEHAGSLHLPVVRRATGGGAILHDRELTYSLVIPQAQQTLGAAPWIYRAVHEAIAACLAEFGLRATRFADSGQAAVAGEPFLCFERRTEEDLVIDGHKILGSAQRRGPGGLLQHGSLLLGASPAAPHLPGIAELGGGRPIERAELMQRISEKLAALCGVQWEAAEVTAPEQALARSVAAGKFASAAWTQRR